MSEFIINGLPEVGSTFLSQIESDTKNIEEVLEKLDLKTEGNTKRST